MFETDGEADDRMLGPHPGLPPHSPTGKKDTCQDVRIAGHQAVSRPFQVCVYTGAEKALTVTLALVQDALSLEKEEEQEA